VDEALAVAPAEGLGGRRPATAHPVVESSPASSSYHEYA
jgi:hypothetical protein